MNATKWLSLTGFVKWLGKEGKCLVDETEKGWFVTWIDRDPDTIARQEALAKKKKMDKDDEERILDFVEKQVDRAQRAEANTSEFTEFKRPNEDEKIVVKLSSGSGNNAGALPKSAPVSAASNIFSNALKSQRDKWETSSSISSRSTASSMSKRPKTALEQIREDEERRKAKKLRRAVWLSEGIIVKIVSKRFGDKFYSQKGFITKVYPETAEAMIKMLKCGTTLKVDQERLETVIPSLGGPVMIVNGEMADSIGVLETVDKDEGVGTIKIKSGPNKGRIVKKLFDAFSKLHEED